jgi:hypothetical protein
MVRPLAFGDFGKGWIADVCVDDRDCRTREVTESEAEVNDHGRDGNVVTRGDKSDDADSFIVNSSRNSRACGFDVTHRRVVELDADRREERIVITRRRDFGTVWHR